MILQETRQILGSKKNKDNIYPCFKFSSNKDEVFSDNYPERYKKDIGTEKYVLPYTTQDNYLIQPETIEVKFIILENEYMRAEFLPEYGGRLYSLYDKRNNKELFLKNKSVAAHNIGLRNAWFAGGVEWNVGNYGHCYTTYDNVFCAKLKDNEGNDFLRIYEFERLKSVFWQIDFHLPKEATQLMCYVKLFNPFNEPTTIYYWSNMGLPYDRDMRFIFSGEEILHRGNGKMNFSTLPHAYKVNRMEEDITYPKNLNMIFEYYVQNETNNPTPWQLAIYPNKDIVYEISTQDAYCKKMFHWGEHPGANSWQHDLAKYTNEKKYIEMQTGIAPSQFHDKSFPANSVYQWSHAFGYARSAQNLFGIEYQKAKNIANFIMYDKCGKLIDFEKKMQVYADYPIAKTDIIHCGSGFGALEVKRIELDKDGYVPKSLLFPTNTIGAKEQPWLDLLTTGKLSIPKEEDISYMISSKWIHHVEADVRYNPTWYNSLHYGIMAMESRIFDVVYSERKTDNSKITCKYAESALRQSIQLKPTALAEYCLAELLRKLGRGREAVEIWKELVKKYDIDNDMALREIYCQHLLNTKQYQKLWETFIATKQSNTYYYDRISIHAARAAVVLKKYNYLEQFCKIPHPIVREGETILTDIWFSYMAQLNKKPNESIEEAHNRIIKEMRPPQHLDYRFGGNTKPKLIVPV